MIPVNVNLTEHEMGVSSQSIAIVLVATKFPDNHPKRWISWEKS